MTLSIYIICRYFLYVKAIKEEVFRDYLLELILLAEKTDPSDRQLKSLAEHAADLEHIPVVDINTNVNIVNFLLTVAFCFSCFTRVFLTQRF